MHTGGAIATVLLVGVAVWLTARCPWDKPVRRGPKVLGFAPGPLAGVRERRGLFARVRRSLS
jgi:hypothetical protein